MADTWRHTCNLGESLVYVLDRVANERNARHLRPPRFLLVVSSTRKDTASERINIVPTLLLFNAFRIALLSRREQRKRSCIKPCVRYVSKKNRRHYLLTRFRVVDSVINQFSRCFEVRASDWDAPKGYWNTLK